MNQTTITCPQCSIHIEINPQTQAVLQGHEHFHCPSCDGLVAVPALIASCTSVNVGKNEMKTPLSFPTGKRIKLALGIAVSSLLAYFLFFIAIVSLIAWSDDRTFLNQSLIIAIVSLSGAIVMVWYAWRMSSLVRRSPNGVATGNCEGCGNIKIDEEARTILQGRPHFNCPSCDEPVHVSQPSSKTLSPPPFPKFSPHKSQPVKTTNAFQDIAKIPILGGCFNTVISLVIPYIIGYFLLPGNHESGNISTGLIVIAWNAAIIYFLRVGYWLGVVAGCITFGAGIYELFSK